jgi:hypothetical protein
MAYFKCRYIILTNQTTNLRKFPAALRSVTSFPTQTAQDHTFFSVIISASLLATPVIGNTRYWQHPLLATPVIGNTRYWQHPLLATPVIGNTLYLTLPPSSNLPSALSNQSGRLGYVWRRISLEGTVWRRGNADSETLTSERSAANDVFFTVLYTG